MKKLSTIFLLVLLSAILSFGKSIPLFRRPQCVCSRKVTAIMQDFTGTYCVNQGPEGFTQWHCENKEEWLVYFENMQKASKEPKCKCSGNVTAVMQDATGTYCVYFYEGFNHKWECENLDEWKEYRRNNKEY